MSLTPSATLVAQPNNLDPKNVLTLTDIARKLRNLNLVTEATYKEITHLIEQDGINSRSTLLYQLQRQALNRLLPRELRGSPVNIGISVENLTNEMRSELLKLLNQLRNSDVVSQRVYEKLQADIAAGRIKMDIQLFQYAAMQMEIDERFPIEVQQPYLNSLYSTGIFSAEGYTRLLQDLKSGNIKDKIEFLKYSDRALIFHLRDYSLNPYDYFPKIHSSVTQMLINTGVANISFENFSLELVKDTGYSDDKSYKAIASIRVNGKLYQQSSFYSVAEDNEDFIGRIESEEFLNLFNKILRDRGSEYRLYEIQAFSNDLGMPALDHSRFGVIALTENQAKAYFKQKDLHQETKLTTDRIEEILSLFQKIGLFNHLTQEQITAGRQKIIQSYITHPNDLLQAFDNLVVTVEWESGDVENPYQELTHHLAAVSRGMFTPSDISNEFDWQNQTAGQSFTLNNRRYSTKLEFNDDFLDPEFFTFIEQVVEQTVPDGRFYPLYQGAYDIIGYIFLTNEQRRILQSEGLVVLEASTKRN
ncbi:hypothetical protein A6770_22725 [Nostoc minutum NIES-26]|uniref:Uncharacterized protein n=1 Tax=Nostoc minutum NIES-26 TaxID=1844469 RepID=A0A367QYJ4_9NOSO|nr:hypothetical protein A6770_22725 [Nostoc minutum NIES-26]